MTPDQLSKSGSEHSHQVALFAYIAVVHQYGWEIADIWSETGSMPQVIDAQASPKVPELEWLHAIPNGGSRGNDKKTATIRGAALKAEGVRSGVADVFLPVPKKYKRCANGSFVYRYCGLYVEMKKPDLKPVKDTSKGGLSEEQISFKNYALKNDYGWIVCYSWREAAKAIRSYLEWIE